MSLAPRIWLITGASSGFGRALTEVVLAQEEIAVATLRTPSDLEDLAVTNPDRLLVVKCDVTKLDEVTSAFSAAIERFGRVDVVFNSAGYAIVGEIEAVPEAAARTLFDVNFWGAAAVSKEAVRIFRDVNPPGIGGRLLNVSSGVGFCAGPIVGMYAACKQALEGFTESLRLEMNPAWNIKISTIAPGAFRTRAHTTAAVFFPVPDAYRGEGLPSQVVRDWFQDGSGIRGDPGLGAEAIYRFSTLESPPMRWAMGKDSISGVRRQIKQVTAEIDDFESWSDNLEVIV
ncbi:hypothetical protein C8R45DRAFT_991132 [Mycena sanguinolenta]|nr:hypothetical protein C8R45DRAFT_991132 [Mycena sanguinolenta]